MVRLSRLDPDTCTETIIHEDLVVSRGPHYKISMSFEMPEQLESVETEKKKLPIGKLEEGEKPDAFAQKMELLAKATFKLKTVGEENLKSIPPDRRVIFVTTHITNSDVPLALAALGQDFHLAVGDASTNHNISENPFGYLGDTLAGSENFMPISRQKNANAPSTGIFDPEDFEKMQDTFHENKALVLSAYYIDRNKDLKLPEKGGYGAAYLAEMADAVVVPVAINIKSKEAVNTVISGIKAALSRPEAEVVIGEPFELEKMENVSAVKEIMAKRKQGSLSKEDIAAFKQVSHGLRERSDVLMQHLAELLPEEKRGSWNSPDKTL